jgi:hypothetical protein
MDARQDHSRREPSHCRTEETVEFTASNGSPPLISGSLSCPKRLGLKTALRCVLPPLIKTIYRRPVSLLKNSESAEKSRVLGWAAVVSPACLSSCIPSSQCLPADSAVGRFWRWTTSPCVISCTCFVASGRVKYGGLEVSEARRLKSLEDENRRLKKLLAEAMLDNVALKDLLGKKRLEPAPHIDLGLSAG